MHEIGAERVAAQHRRQDHDEHSAHLLRHVLAVNHLQQDAQRHAVVARLEVPELVLRLTAHERAYDLALVLAEEGQEHAAHREEGGAVVEAGFGGGAEQQEDLRDGL